jgi:hypothetical protein
MSIFRLVGRSKESKSESLLHGVTSFFNGGFCYTSPNPPTLYYRAFSAARQCLFCTFTFLWAVSVAYDNKTPYCDINTVTFRNECKIIIINDGMDQLNDSSMDASGYLFNDVLAAVLAVFVVERQDGKLARIVCHLGLRFCAESYLLNGGTT